MKLQGSCALTSLLLTAGLALSACGGGSGDDNTPQPLVSFSEKVAGGTIENYTDANWLFQNYFGEYGIPEALKPSFMPAMKLLANGFMLQYKTGQDVRGNIEQVHSLFLQYAASDEGAKFLAQVQAGAALNGSAPMAIDPSQIPQEMVPEPVVSEEDRVQIAAAKERDQRERQEILETAEKYGLPYRLDEFPEQWFIYSPTMKGGGKGGGGGGGSPEPKHHPDVTAWGWRPGDVIWVNGTGSVAGVPGHNALAWGDRGVVRFVEANTDKGVSVKTDVQQWADRYTEMRALTPKLHWDSGEFICYRNYGASFGCKADSYQRMFAWTYATERVSYPYNWNFLNPRDQSRFYCSSLVWNAYDKAGYNIIAPKVLGNLSIVLPSDIRDSGALTTFRVSKL